jgi:hypothetical protein
VNRVREFVAEVMCLVALESLDNPGRGRLMMFGFLLLLAVPLWSFMVLCGHLIKYLCRCAGLPT